VRDGRYLFQLDAATSEVDTTQVAQNNGRAGRNIVRPRRGDSFSGSFLVRNGSIVRAAAAGPAPQRGNDSRDR
jgi:hypothetical protein